MCLVATGIFSAASGAQGAVEQVVVVFKTHFDIGYTDMASNVVQRYRTTMIDDALKVVDKNRSLPPEQQFVWTLPGWPVSKIVEDWPGQSFERKERIRQAFSNGRFVVHALPFTTHTELLEAEDLVRGMGYSSRLSRSLSLQLPRDAKMTDVPSHCWILPTLLKHAGVDFLHLGCNAASSSPQVPPLFWWEGPDGSKLLTMYTAESYGTGLVPPTNWPHKTWLAMIQTGDNHGPPTPEEVAKLLVEAKEKLPGVKVRIGRLSDFADALLAEKPTLPVVNKDMPDTWIHGPMADPAGTKLARNTRAALIASEILDTELQTWGVRLPNNSAQFAKAWEQSLLYGEHTWGGAQYWVTAYGNGTKWGYGDVWKADEKAGRFARLEGSWAEHTAYIENANRIVSPVLQAHLNALAQNVKVKGPRIVVFNSLPWSREGVVTVDVSAIKGSIETLHSMDGRDVIPVQNEGGTIRFVCPSVPSMGYRTFMPTVKTEVSTILKADSKAGVIENRWFKVAVDPEKGFVRSIIHKSSGREWIDPSVNPAFGQVFYERFDRNNIKRYTDAYVKVNEDWAFNELGKPAMPPADQVLYRAAVPSKTQWHVEQTPVSVTLVMEAQPGEGVPFGEITRIQLYRDQTWIDLEVTLRDKPADPWPEAGWLCLPFVIEDPQFALGRLGGIANPATDFVAGGNVDTIALNGGMTVTDREGQGMGLCAVDNPLVSLGEPGCWKYSKTFTPRKSRVFVNLFNNQWTTNFRMWNSGTWTSRVRLWAASSRAVEQSLVTPSEEARFPLMAGAADGKAGTLGVTKRGIELSRRGVKVTAFGANPDGEGLVLRLWEAAGSREPCTVRLPAEMKIKSVQPIDLRGRSVGAPLSLSQTKQGAVFKAVLDKYAPASFKLETQP